MGICRSLNVPIVIGSGERDAFAEFLSRIAEAMRTHGCANLTVETVKGAAHYVVEEKRQPRRADSIVATSIFVMDIMASKARFASAPPAASASVSARGVICHERPQRSLHQPHALS